MKSIIINSEQESLIKEEVAHHNGVQSLPSFILKAIRDNTTPLSDLSISKQLNQRALESMFVDAFNEAKENFSDDITSFPINKIVSKLDKLVTICQKKEEPIKDMLEKLCADVATSIFNDEKTTVICHLINSIPDDKQFHVDSIDGYEYMDINHIDNTALEVEHRKLENTVIMGGALRLYDRLQNKLVGELFKLDEDLPHLYSKIIKINNYLLFVDSQEITDKNHMQSGYVDVTLAEDKKTTIESYGMIFPFLLIETIRGFMERAASISMSDKEDDFENIIDKADLLKYEPWYMMIGTQIWDKLIPSDFEIKYINHAINGVFNLTTTEFNHFIHEVICNTKMGKNERNKLLNKSMYDNEYSSFEKDLQIKRGKSDVITDDLSTGDNKGDLIDEANYQENFSIEEFKNISSFAGKVRYCKERLRYLGQGTSRMVFMVDDNTVLKIAKNKKGIAQNEVEGRLDYYKEQIGLFPKIYNADFRDNMWIETQLAKKARVGDFLRIENVSFEIVQAWIIYVRNSFSRKDEQLFLHEKYVRYFESDKFNERYSNDYGILNQLYDYVANYQIRVIGDLVRISSWGVVKDEDGTESLVIVDSGLSDSVASKYYEE